MQDCAHLHALLCIIYVASTHSLTIQDCFSSDRCRDPVLVKEGIDVSRTSLKIFQRRECSAAVCRAIDARTISLHLCVRYAGPTVWWMNRMHCSELLRANASEKI